MFNGVCWLQTHARMLQCYNQACQVPEVPECLLPLLLCCAQIADGYFVKYFASCVALLVYAGPIYFMNPASRGDQGQLTADYIRRSADVHCSD
jgi:hypothetical protein